MTLEQLNAQVPPDKVKFTPNELIERALHRGVRSKPPKEKAAHWISKHWKTLTQWLIEAEEKLIQAARDQGMHQLPDLKEDQSLGGPGNSSYYSLIAKPLPPATVNPYPIPPGGISYQAERRRLIRLSWLWHIGVPLTRRRRVIASIPFILIYGVGVLVGFGPFIVASLIGYRLSLAAVGSVMITITTTAALLYGVVGPYFITRFQRVMRAPDWLIPLKDIDPCVLEWMEASE